MRISIVWHKRCLQREYGWAFRGKQVEDTRSGSSFRRVHVISARCNGEHRAVTCYTHTTKADLFEQWFADGLLKAVPSGCTMILDNASFHRKREEKYRFYFCPHMLLIVIRLKGKPISDLLRLHLRRMAEALCSAIEADQSLGHGEGPHLLSA